ncbi:MAG: potassium transporter TrkG [Pseudomonadota bacterium]
MAGTLTRVPLLVLLAGVLSASMYLPSVHALIRDDHFESRTFFYYGTIFLALTGAVALATARHRSRNITRSHLVALLLALTVLPLVAAAPLLEIVGDTRPVNGWLEMVAAVTTTGGSVFDPDRLSSTLHLWRALVAWQGGLLIWIAAAAILAPLRLGGFEVVQDDEADRPVSAMAIARQTLPERRILRAAGTLIPVYTALTVTLGLILAALGEAPTTAAIHAMSTMATSGITGPTPIQTAEAGIAGEAVIFAFLFFAVSRQTFAADLYRGRLVHLSEDRELRIAAIVVAGVTAILFARHWIGAFEIDMSTNVPAASAALWGAAFTVLSHLTTTGFVSSEWAVARAWSGLQTETPAVLLLGLAMFGGGVATTAGGVKLLRIFALYAHGRREMNLLVHPHSVAGGPGAARRIPARGIEAAWIFFMLFAVSIATVTLGLTAAGLDFEAGLVLAVAGLSTTGPLAAAAFGPGQDLTTITDAAKFVFAAAMVVGRLETLALIALFNPDFWRP